MAHDASDARPRRSRRVAIIGAGPGGICTGVALLARGHDDFVILEQAPGIGGTWFHNRYPGAECDIKSHLYSFSFAPNPAWSRRYARQPEIKAYLEDVVDRFDLRPHLRLSTPVRSMRWDDDEAVWHITVGDGDGNDEIVDADVVVSAIGMFGEPVEPDVPGLDRFQGTMFHSADWADDHDLTGERVAVIGSAASAVQLIPEIAPVVESLHRLPAHTELGLAQGRRPVLRRRAGGVRGRSRRAPGVARRDLHHHRPEPAPSPTPNGARSTSSTDAATSTWSRTRSSAPGMTPDGAVRLQATAGVEPLLPDVQPAARRARHRADHRGHRARDRDGRRHDARGRHHRPRHRLRHHEVPRRARRGRPRRARHRRRVVRRRAGVPRHHHERASRTCSCSTARTPTTGRSST